MGQNEASPQSAIQLDPPSTPPPSPPIQIEAPPIQVEVKLELLTCSKCNKQLSSKYCLTRHKQICSLARREAKKVSCQFCQKGFTRQDYLKKHSLICEARAKKKEDAAKTKISEAGQFFAQFNEINSIPILG